MYKRTHNKIFHCPGQFPAIFYANPKLSPKTRLARFASFSRSPSPGRHLQEDRCRADALVALSFQAIESKLSALK